MALNYPHEQGMSNILCLYIGYSRTHVQETNFSCKLRLRNHTPSLLFLPMGGSSFNKPGPAD